MVHNFTLMTSMDPLNNFLNNFENIISIFHKLLACTSLSKVCIFPQNNTSLAFTVYHIYVAIIKLVFVHTFPVLIYDTSRVLYVQQIAFI